MISSSDCVNKSCRPKSDAPVMLDSLCDSCKKHLTSVLDTLDKLDIGYILDPLFIKNGVWSKIIFDIVDKNSNIEILSGGRMDNLSKILSGSKVPAVGFSFFLSNILKILGDERVAKLGIQNEEVFIASIGEEAKNKSILIMDMFYKNNIRIQTLFDDISLQMKMDAVKKFNSRIVLILGQKEVYDDIIIIRDMLTGLQEVVAIDEVVSKVKNKLKKLTNMGDCIFCKIISGEIKAFIIDENELYISILDINPKAKGHAVVIPKRHSETILGLNDDELKDFRCKYKKTRFSFDK